MQQALAILVLYLSALAIGQGLPVNNVIPPPRPPPQTPEAMALSLHANCVDIGIATARDDRLGSRPGSSGSPGSPGSSASNSRSETPRMRRAEDIYPDLLVADCNNPQGGRHEIQLSLNRCFGWDPERVGLTVQKKYASCFVIAVACYSIWTFRSL
ncbi:hypothetical protein ABOM_001883 [Aspergillus bombycis]|uniref:Uncharacterized protein n=1 Tax=Aspergillus bombycis TaxID=109264 RepID=A0A1F8ADI9_9EURO|nr:hypothetical protein ABOM_001883 [Aspergillus bombycis]OGM49721.1 hypothetical protein ABOM_001883 [Aspergillus bombycis]